MLSITLAAFLLFTTVYVNLGVLAAQTAMYGSRPGEPVRLLPSDQTILEIQEPRDDLPCTVVPIKPALGFDLRFHAGYEVSIPLKDIVGSENLLTTVFRVVPQQRKDEPAYFVQRVQVPAIEPDAKGDAYLRGYFDLGEGEYHVDWLMRDRAGHVCSFYWDIEAARAPKDKQLNLALSPGEVQVSAPDLFREEPPVQQAQNEPSLNVKVLINFAPQNAYAASFQPLDVAALVSILRGIAREPRIGHFSIVAFNLQQQRILYQQNGADRIDFPRLGKALGSLSLGTIDLKRLSEKNSETEFLAQLIQKEMGTGDHPDAVIFAGPKVMLDENVAQEALREVREVECPVFYMNYDMQPQSNPSTDAIGRVVKFFRGYEYTITRPRDLWVALNEIVSRVARFKDSRSSFRAVPR